MRVLPKITSPSGIYIIRCIANGRFYIGSSQDMLERLSRHRYRLRGNKHDNIHLQRAWNKYGEDSFTTEVLEYCPEETLFTREQHYLDTLKPFGKVGFNILPNADGRRGHTATEETRRKIGLAQLGRKRSPETVAKMHIWRQTDLTRADAVNDKTRISFSIVSPEGERFDVVGMKRFCKQHDLSEGYLREVINGCVRAHKGWHLPTTTLRVDVLVAPDGTEHRVLERGLKGFCRRKGLRYIPMLALTKGSISRYNDWTCVRAQHELPNLSN